MKEISTLFGPQPIIEPQEIIRALWWNQPYASLMLPPYNKIETRRRATNVRGKVLICACKAPYEFSTILAISKQYQTDRIFMEFENMFDLPMGQAIAIGELVDCRPMKKEDEDRCYVSHRPELFVWIFENVQPIEPFAIRGKQGWSILDKEAIDKIKVLSTTGKPENL